MISQQAILHILDYLSSEQQNREARYEKINKRYTQELAEELEL